MRAGPWSRGDVRPAVQPADEADAPGRLFDGQHDHRRSGEDVELGCGMWTGLLQGKAVRMGLWGWLGVVVGGLLWTCEWLFGVVGWFRVVVDGLRRHCGWLGKKGGGGCGTFVDGWGGFALGWL